MLLKCVARGDLSTALRAHRKSRAVGLRSNLESNSLRYHDVPFAATNLRVMRLSFATRHTFLLTAFWAALSSLVSAQMSIATGPPAEAVSEGIEKAAAAQEAPTRHETVNADGKSVKTAETPEKTPLFNVLVQLGIGDKYVTPRGMIVRENGVTFQPLLLVFLNAYRGGGFINSITLVGGVWNDFGTNGVSKHAPFGSDPTTGWTETDPIAGIAVGFAKRFKLEVTYTAFDEYILDIPTSHHLETKLSFDDTDYLKAFALHPYFSYWQELWQKSTDAQVPFAVLGPSVHSGDHPNPGSSFYFDIGIKPGYTFKSLGDLKLEAPCRVLLADDRFYGEYYKSSSTITVGLFELGLKATLPLKFMPKEAGHWNVALGFRYMNFANDNLEQLNTFNAPQKPVRDTSQVYGGFSVFF
jgi:hypothetical protein